MAFHYKWVQNRLKKLGFYKGAIDGINGANIRAAVKAFQKAARLKPATGNVGPRTLFALKSNKYKKKIIRRNGVRHKFMELKCKDGTFPVSAQKKYAKAGTLHIAERIENETGLRLIFMSGYRSPSWNKKQGGAKASQHTELASDGGCTAIDLLPANGNVVKLYKKALQLYNKGVIRGVGKYRTFVHIDRRKTAKSIWSG